MKPYIAIIIDSFREALASRILWLVLVAILVFLAVLVPLGIRDDLTIVFRDFDVVSGQRLVSLLEEGATKQRETPARRIALALDASTQKKLKESSSNPDKPTRTHTVIDSLNKLLDSDDWYDEEIWKNTLRLRELRDLDSEADLSEVRQKRRRRLRIESALPGAFHPSQGDAVRLYYGTLSVPDELVISRMQFVEIVNTVVLPSLLNILLGWVGAFVAVLVTSSIVPEMFRSGSLQLLLSKPVSRSLLYIAKVVGGCSFVIVSFTAMIMGLWLIFGFRLEIWNHRLLICIPLFVFWFMVYYSVSSLAGLIWKNAIVSVAITVLFFMACLIVGGGNNLMDFWIVSPKRIEFVAESGGEIIATTRQGRIQRWDSGNSDWSTIVEPRFGGRTRSFVPAILTESGELVTAQIRSGPFNAFSRRDDKLQIISESEDWNPIEGIALPAGTRSLFAGPDNSVLTFGTSGVQRAERRDLEPSGKGQSNMFDTFLSMMGGPRSEGFQSVSPPGLMVNTPMSACVVEGPQSMVIYSRGRLMHLEHQGAGEPMLLVASIELEGESGQRAAVAANETHVVLVREDSGIEVFELSELKSIHVISTEELGSARSVTASGGAESSQFALLFSPGELRLLDAASGELVDRRVPGHGSVGAAGWASDGHLLVAHDIDRISTVQSDAGQTVSSFRPSMDIWRMIYAFGVNPLYRISPRPQAIEETVSTFVMGDDEIELGPPSASVDLDFDRQTLDTWTPLINGGVFIVLVLAGGCLYVARQDF